LLKVNQGDARVYGVEANAGWGIGDDFVLQGGLVLQRARYADPEPNFGSTDFFRTPNHYGNLTMTWTTARLGTVFAGLRYTGPMKAPHYAGYIDEDRLETTPGFVTVDASVAYPLYVKGTRRLTATLAGRNLTNAFQEDRPGHVPQCELRLRPAVPALGEPGPSGGVLICRTDPAGASWSRWRSRGR
jgi:outer membrane receptor for ferrienterochelin and colicins